MKKVTLLLVMFAFLANIAMAQSSEVQNAFNNNRQAQTCIEYAEQAKKQNRVEKANKEMNNAKLLLQKAKTSIDNASQNERTMGDAKTWHYYGVIYLKIATYPEFSVLDAEALEKSSGAFIKVYELDQEYFAQNQYEIMSYINAIGTNYFNNGSMAFDAGDYAKAIDCYRKSYDTMTILGQQDNAALLNAVQIAVKMAHDYSTAIEICEILLNNAYEDPQVYLYMAKAQGESGNEDLMLQYLQTGREKYPDDENLINEQIETYIKLKREVEIVDQIKEMAQTHNDNYAYSYILGTIYGNMESPIYNVDSAVCYYKKAIEINPNDEYSYAAIAGLYIDESNAIKNEAEAILDNAKNFNEAMKKSDAMMKESDAVLEQALPYIEKAHELAAEDMDITRVLKSVYVRLKMMEKAKAIDSAVR